MERITFPLSLENVKPKVSCFIIGDTNITLCMYDCYLILGLGKLMFSLRHLNLCLECNHFS